MKRPFPKEAELVEKSERLSVLNVALNIDGKDKPRDKEERQACDGKTSIDTFLSVYNSLMVSVTAIFRIRLAGAWMAARVATITNKTTISSRETGSVHTA